jgi:predicted CXXCH cytochrome family protein
MFLAVGFLFAGAAYPEVPSHSDKFKVNEGCGACHSGHGRRNTPMLRKTVPGLCYDCHGAAGSSLSGTASTEVYYEMRKRYRHQVEETSRYHKKNEVLPEKRPSEPRHVSCLDCHDAHVSEKSDPTKGVMGYDGRGKLKSRSDRISEICYKCHSDSRNRPFDSPDTLQDFDSSNASYHPVEKSAKLRSVSLIPELSGKTIECSDCHNPHGSEYEHMLRHNYRTADGAESQAAYALCYSCHRRDSILSDRGFRYHKQHIVFAGASCKTCHSAHGSNRNARLISFNSSVVKQSRSGMLQYVSTGKDADCYLSCHGAEHNGNNVAKSIRKKVN